MYQLHIEHTSLTAPQYESIYTPSTSQPLTNQINSPQLDITSTKTQPPLTTPPISTFLHLSKR